MGFSWGIVGLDFFIFRSRGVARKWSRMRTGGESASTVGGVGADSGGWGGEDESSRPFRSSASLRLGVPFGESRRSQGNTEPRRRRDRGEEEEH